MAIRTMHIDPAIPIFVASIFFVVFLIILMRWMKQSHVVVYILAGFILGPHILGVITDSQIMNRAGSLGVVLLLFFVGMESSPKRLAQNWFISVFGTLLQIVVSIGAIALLGQFLEWPWSRIIFFGCVISLSSTAVALKLLEDWKELQTRVGQDVHGILLVQDLLIVPIVILLELLGGGAPSGTTLTLQVVGGVALLLLAAWLIYVEEIRLPWIHHLERDHEMQLFIALGICFGMATATGLLGLSAPLGAFIGGMIVATARQTHWVRQSLSSLRTVFMAVFFGSVGMMLDVRFISEYYPQIALLVAAAVLTNTLINAGILKALGARWNTSLYAGSLLSPIAEFSFVLAALGVQGGLLNAMGYQITISVISITLIVSPFWIALIKYLTNMKETELTPL